MSVEVKWQEREANHLPPFTADVRKEWILDSGLFTHRTQEPSMSLPNTRLSQCPLEEDSSES